MKRLLLLTILALTVWSVPSPSRAADLAGSSQAMENERRAHDERTMEERFRKLGRDLDELNARARTMAKKARTEADRQLAEAERKRAVAGRKLEALKAEGEKEWNKFATDAREALDEFDKAYERAKEHFRE